MVLVLSVLDAASSDSGSFDTDGTEAACVTCSRL